MDFSGCRDDASFGPAVQGGCRGGFDFTLRFEQIFLAMLPSAIFVATSLPRFVYLWQQPVMVPGGTVLRAAKLALITAMAGVQTGLLGVSAAGPSTPFHALFVASSALYLTASFCALALSNLEHTRSPRPSLLLTAYLFLAILFDATQARTLWLGAGPGSAVFCRLFSAALASKAVLLLLESLHKTRALEQASSHRSDSGEDSTGKGKAWNIKEHSPEEFSGLIELGAFAWLGSLFFQGFRTVLRIDDLYQLDASMGAERLHAQFARHVQRKASRDTGGERDKTDKTDGDAYTYDFGRRRFGLVLSLARSLIVPVLLPVGPRIAKAGFQFCQPFLINATLQYLQQTANADASSPAPARSHSYGLIGAAVIVYVGTALSTAFYSYLLQRSLTMMISVLSTAVYHKTTSSRIGAADDTAALTLMSTDVERVRYGFRQLHDFWANIIQVALAGFLLYRTVGASFAATLAVVFVSMIVTFVLATIIIRWQKRWMETIQKRVSTTANAVLQMKHLRISGLTGPMESIVQGLRMEELRVGSRFRLVLSAVATNAFVPTLLAPVFTFATMGREIDVTTVFTALSYIILLTAPLVETLQSFSGFMAALACLDRVQAFLEADPRIDFREGTGSLARLQQNKRENPPGIDATVAGDFGWTSEQSSLRDMTVSIPAGQLTIVVGPVASGKSTLCKALLGETLVNSGQLCISHLFGGAKGGRDRRPRRIGFCDQTSYLSNCSIRDNILGLDTVSSGAAVDEARYREAVEAALLPADFAQLPLGDRTAVGSNGISLSGGQKQRVAIARALYADTDLYVFDDVLSGLDANTEEQVFQRVFGRGSHGNVGAGVLRRRGATVVLCTHAVRHLPAADHVVALSAHGTVVEQGDFSSLLANRKYVHSLGVADSAGSSDSSSDSDSDSSAMRPRKRTFSGSVHARNDTREPDLDELMLLPSAGAVSAVSAVSAASAASAGEASTDARRLLGDKDIYRFYVGTIGRVSMALFLILGVLFGFLYNWGGVWLKFWVADVEPAGPHDHSTAFYLGLYGLFQVIAIGTIFASCVICFMNMTRDSGARLHAVALHTVMSAPLRFFTHTDTGVITNYFSQDITLIDGELPMSLINTYSMAWDGIGGAAVIATSSPWLCLLYPVLIAVLYGIQMFYLRTSRQLRLLDLEAKSPLYTHFLDTITGLATFRAFGWLESGIALNSQLVDRSQRPAYLLMMIQHWLSFVMGMVVAVLGIGVVSLSTQMHSNAGFTGASLVSLMNFGNDITTLIMSYTQLETSIGAVSRIRSLSDTVKSESENDSRDETVEPSAAWPTRGEIQLSDVSAAYDNSDDDKSTAQLVLDHINLTIHAGEKVAICGRSGSGKSSFLLLLLRMLDPVPETDASALTIDGVPLAHIDRVALRERVIAVSQDAVFLPDGTPVQQNLDPLGAADGAALAAGYDSGADMARSALEAVGLWAFIESRGGLEAGLVADTLSQGQRQLFSLARAILRRRVRAAAPAPTGEWTGTRQTDGTDGERGLLLLDEVSSSVDQETEREMQRVIGSEFAGYTVVMVSHRLDMVMEACDRVVVLDRGRVAEVGRPQELASTEGSRFGELWRVGREEAK